ncbi:MAG: peptide chain release factor aRF-1 [Aeropyrum sp.]|nr:peptide chain release factor aRF-1 [Aeropyrum sp.]MCE4616714.1 peptide chain release factor aRF-1 [Aeropyrum sp.]
MSQKELEAKLTISKRELAKLLRELKKWSAPATVLLSLYIPPGRPVSDVMTLLRQEYSITDNIKLKRTRQAVKRALSAAMDRLQMVPSVPKNGLVIFCGEDMNTGKFECYMFSPPEPIRVFYYRTDKRFITDFLEDMVEDRSAIGIIVVERDQATIGLLKGARLEVLKELEGFVPGKHKMGGQSQRRYERIIEQMVDEFFKKVGEEANNLLVPLVEKGLLKGVLVAGPGLAKQEFVEGGYLDYRLRKILAKDLVDVAYQGLQGLKEAVMKAERVVEAQLYRDAVSAMEEFKSNLARGTGMVVYGDKEVEYALEMGAVKTLLIHESREDLEEWVERARQRGAQAVIVPETLPEAEWFLHTFGGLAGILRFRVSF